MFDLLPSSKTIHKNDLAGVPPKNGLPSGLTMFSANSGSQLGLRLLTATNSESHWGFPTAAPIVVQQVMAREPGSQYDLMAALLQKTGNVYPEP